MLARSHKPHHNVSHPSQRGAVPGQVDVFRIGTLLELARELAQALAQDGKRVKISVQQAMGQGIFQVQTPDLLARSPG